MAKRKPPKRVCLIDGCNRIAVGGGAKACRDDFNPIALRAEIERLRDGQLIGVDARQILRYPEVCLLLETLAPLAWATGSKSANGKLGAAISIVKKTADEVGRIAGPPSEPPPRTHCGQPTVEKASFCGECGARLRPQRRVRASGAPVRATGASGTV